jgi:molecular chaperone DnaK (HSP70)
VTAVGIDLGTTISSVAKADDSQNVTLARLRDGSPRLRSVVAFEADGRVVVGDEAQSLAPLDPDSSFAFFKRRMGTDWEVPHGNRRWTAPQLSAELLKAMVADAAEDLGERPRQAAVTIPAYFGDDARRATLEAGELAGLDIIALPHEPTAACLAYEPEPGRSTTQLVYDLGGGTFDVSVVRFTATGAEVLATAGDDQLGGKDWDNVLVDLIADQVESQTGFDPRDDLVAVTDILERARDAKHALSSVKRTAVTLQVAGGMRRAEVTREQFEAVAAALFAKTEALVERVLDDVGGRGVIDTVLLVGGSSRMPKCRASLVKATGIEPRMGVDPDAAVVTGAALVARNHGAPPRPRPGGGGYMTQRAVRDVTAHALGFVVVSADGSRYVNEVMIKRNAPIPATATKRHQLAVARDDSGVLDVYMLQGEAQRPLDTNPLGRWTFEGVPGNRRGSVDIDVAYKYDEHGVVHVSAAVGGTELRNPRIDRDDRDLRWTEEDPSAHSAPELAVALVIDVSGSMSGNKLAEAKDACVGFVDVLEEAGVGDRIVLVPFGTSARVAAPLGSSAEDVRRATRALSVDGTTNMAHGLGVAWSALRASDGRRVLVLLTDGAPNDQQLTLDEREAVVRGDGEIIARGVTGADDAFLQQLDSGSELLGAGELVSSFRGIAKQLAGSAGGRAHVGLGRRR